MKRSNFYGGAIASIFAALILVNVYHSDSENSIDKTDSGLIRKEEFLKNHLEKKRNSYGKDKFKYDNPNAYLDYYWGIRTRTSELFPGYMSGTQLNELKKAKNNRYYQESSSARTAGLEWKERGPSNVPGRTRAIHVLSEQDPTQNTWLTGGVGGGIWKTTDAGNSWTLKTSGLPSMAISWLASCKAQPDIIYASTGEFIGGSVGLIGNGVLKSEDGGESWYQLPSTANKIEFSFIGRVVVDQTNPDVVLISTTQGEWDSDFRSQIYKSVDGGNSWYKTYESDAWITQVIASMDDFNTIYAAKWAFGVMKSDDAGETWHESNFGIHKVFGRVELAIALSDSDRLYAAAQGNISGSGADLYVSMDAGANWSVIDQKYNDKSIEFFRGQGDYDNTIAVNPFDADEVYYGGVNLWKTNLTSGQQQTDVPVISVDVAKDSLSFWSFVNFDGEYFNGKLETGGSLADSEFLDVEVRTGPGISQLAHRFTVDKKGSGVPDSGYFYMDYVEIPLEIWDVKNNVQLMVSFRDQQEDGAFNLLYQNTEDDESANHSREYLYIHALEYNSAPNEFVAQQGGENTGHQYEQMYFFWPVLKEGHVWDSVNLDADTIKIDFDIVNLVKRFGEMNPVSDAYGDFDENLNGAYAENENGFSFHPDHHNLKMMVTDTKAKTFRILNSNDGGVYVSNSSTTPGVTNGDWSFSGNGYNTGQFYSAAKKPGAEVFIGGLQDNGTWKSPEGFNANSETKYESVWGGDGFDVLWNYVNPNKYIVSIYNNQFYRTEDNGETWYNSSEGIYGLKPFFSKLASSHSAPDVVYTVSSLGVYKSVDFGTNWTLSSIGEDWGFSNFIDIKVSLANPRIVWAGNGMSEEMSIHVSTDAGATFVKTNNFDDAELGYISGLATHPELDSTAFVLFSFSKGPKILRTNDLGETWEDISGFLDSEASSNGFPDVAVYSLLVRPDNPEVLWAGTEIGIFESIDNGSTWSFLDNDMGAAAVWDMNVMDDQVVIATHGRGIFTATLPEPNEITLLPKILTYGTSIKGNLALELELKSEYDSSFIDIDGQRIQINQTGLGNVHAEIAGLPANDTLDILLNAYRKGKTYASDTMQVLIFEVNEPVLTYEQDFNEGTEDFFGDRFLIAKFNGFDDFAIHTKHPYLEGINFPGDSIEYIFQLRTPIIVANNNAIFSYDDVAIIETGELGVKFTSENFYDYVLAEGSKDGINWNPLIEGYDANKNSKWLEAYTNSENGDKSMLSKQTINLRDSFQASDTIFIRFRLHSDPLTTSWGWAIDNVFIQSKITGLEPNIDQEIVFNVYPNPMDDRSTINFTVSERLPVTFNLRDIHGRIVWSKHAGIKNPGNYQEDFTSAGISPGLYILSFDDSKHSLTKKIIVR